MTRIRPLLALTAVALATAAAAQPDTTLQQLLDSLPDPPATPQEAARWLDAQERPVHTGLAAHRRAVEVHKAAMGRLASADAAAGRTQAGVQTEALAVGLNDVGIDLQRMQSDSAYAAQMQQRLQRMTPAEQLALAQRMNASLQQDRRIDNAALAMDRDTPAAKAAFEAGQQFAQANAMAERRAREARLWRDTEAAVAQVYARKLEPGLPRPAMAFDNIGCQAACQAQWQAYAARVLPLMVERETEILKLRAAALRQQRAWVAATIKPIDAHLSATAFGDKSTSRVHREQILAYDLSAVGEVEAVSDRLLDAVRHAAVVVRCDKQAVLVPGAVCSGS
ncbi:hypothetical protein [Pelomonas cellulosilytica]|uniref:Lysozyme inhibitor LprI N-terminal domain-containing protein n=1 Tax=Pelomonas cellulosilytica TaxID=2906762 RepID=A0ABS8XY76_9BURK|nr:hypothetical protein [Pelomonas sp. P8]MCE4556248.1 hypothetical protein [Pelomonas sp. P8]